MPTADAGTATFLVQDRAILFMRYVRKHIECLERSMGEHRSQTL